jgi:hypothetical protein
MRKITGILSVVLLGSVLTVACGGAVESVPATEAVVAEPQDGDAVALTRQYFDLINQAEDEQDLAVPWDLLTNRAQMNPVGLFELSYFQEYWWPLQAEYEIYTCSPTLIDVVLSIHPRGQPASAEDEIKIYQFEMIVLEDGLRIDHMRFIPQVDEGCVLAP